MNTEQSIKPLTDKPVLVAVSALALMVIPYTNPVFAQVVNISCGQKFGFGQHVLCGNGTLQIDPDGSTSLSGCLVEEIAPQPGSCTVVVTGGVATRNVRVQFTSPSFAVKLGGNQVTMSKLRLQERGQPTTAAQLTFTPLELTNPVTLDVGGTMSFSGNLPAGNYSGGLVINADFI